MPARNRVKEYHEQGYYHIYNRGVERRKIFVDEQDKSVFLGYLKNYLLPRNINNLVELLNNSNTSQSVKAQIKKLLNLNNFSDQIDLLAFCLMPNHFHLLVKQTTSRSIELFMKSLCTRYVQYFNHKQNRRIGPLFQGAYKAVLITSDEQLIHTSRYIHLNLKQKGLSLKECPGTSSYKNYLNLVKQEWVKPKAVLDNFFRFRSDTYESFVEDSRNDEVTAVLVEKGLSF